MKNIHLLPTDKPSRLSIKDGVLYLHRLQWIKGAQHIYITSSDEEIKEGDWYWLEKIGKRGSESGAYKSAGLKASKLNTLASNCKKVILTTDQDLITDGVQAIDDEFLQWFVKNPSCEWVEVVDDTLTVGEMYKLPLGVRNHKYKIIIPKEEQKQNLINIWLKWKESKSELSFYDFCKLQLIDMMKDDEKLGWYDVNHDPQIELLSDLAKNLKNKQEINPEDIFNDKKREGVKRVIDQHKVLKGLSLINPLHLQMTESGYGEFPDTYKLTEKGIQYIIEKLNK